MPRLMNASLLVAILQLFASAQGIVPVLGTSGRYRTRTRGRVKRPGCSREGTFCWSRSRVRCCVGYCQANICRAYRSSRRHCLLDGQRCKSDTQCCSARCYNRICRKRHVKCAEAGETCFSESTCCSGICVRYKVKGVYKGHCLCLSLGRECYKNEDCCNNRCHGATSTKPGTCEDSPSTNRILQCYEDGSECRPKSSKCCGGCCRDGKCQKSAENGGFVRK